MKMQMVSDISQLDDVPFMYMTRHILEDACDVALEWITTVSRQTEMLKIARKHVRGREIVLDTCLPHNLLAPKNITWCNNLVDFHWAETDGITIELNRLKPWSRKELVATLIHEALHGYVITIDGHCIPEDKEHKIMCELYHELV